jgi:hypothetical protein
MQERKKEAGNKPKQSIPRRLEFSIPVFPKKPLTLILSMARVEQQNRSKKSRDLANTERMAQETLRSCTRKGLGNSEHVPSLFLSKRAKTSLNAAISSSVKCSAISRRSILRLFLPPLRSLS